MKSKVIYFQLFIYLIAISCSEKPDRKITSLNGEWQLEVNQSAEKVPSIFSSKIIVPGLVDMAVPKIEKPGTKSDSSNYYWYKKEFILDNSTETALLVIHKAKYGKQIWLNGSLVGEHWPSFTRSEFNIASFLNKKGEANELIIRLGNYFNYPDTLVNGHDFEKARFIPGIFDDVEIIQTGALYVSNTQISPDLKNKSIHISAELGFNSKISEKEIEFSVIEKNSRTLVNSKSAKFSGIKNDKINITIPIDSVHEWSHLDPFLYELEINTGSDLYTTSFGMRSFRFDTTLRKAMLNEKPIALHGTNVALYRFFEDDLRSDLPWNKEWVRSLFQKFKELNWYTVRFHVGPAPDFWYDLADEMGILIQDEYAIWYSKGMSTIRPNLKAKHLISEYNEWMRSRWNHPSIIIWDAQNETVTPETGIAINQVRNLDMSDRPWDNGWSKPASATDPIEAHPYLLYDYAKKNVKIPKNGLIEHLFGTQRKPYNDPGIHDPQANGKDFENVRFINEYGWLWVNRNGTLTTLSDNVYNHLYGDVIEKNYFYLYARTEAMLTEYWRKQNNNTGIMHFSALSYSRPEEPRGQTSDNFIDVENQIFEPNFLKYVKPAFAPIGICLDYWKKTGSKKSETSYPIVMTNDTYENWTGVVALKILKEDKVYSEFSKIVNVEAMNQSSFNIDLPNPKKKGLYTVAVEFEYKGETVFSIRDISF